MPGLGRDQPGFPGWGRNIGQGKSHDLSKSQASSDSSLLNWSVGISYLQAHFTGKDLVDQGLDKSWEEQLRPKHLLQGLLSIPGAGSLKITLGKWGREYLGKHSEAPLGSPRLLSRNSVPCNSKSISLMSILMHPICNGETESRKGQVTGSPMTWGGYHLEYRAPSIPCGTSLLSLMF